MSTEDNHGDTSGRSHSPATNAADTSRSSGLSHYARPAPEKARQEGIVHGSGPVVLHRSRSRRRIMVSRRPRRTTQRSPTRQDPPGKSGTTATDVSQCARSAATDTTEKIQMRILRNGERTTPPYSPLTSTQTSASTIAPSAPGTGAITRPQPPSRHNLASGCSSPRGQTNHSRRQHLDRPGHRLRSTDLRRHDE